MEKITLEEFDIKYMEVYNIHDTPISVIKNSYDSWIHYQEWAVSDEEKKKYTYVIWEDFPTALSWLEHQKKKEEERIKQRNSYMEFLKKPWYEREVYDSPIKDKLIAAFINNEEGEKIRETLLLWDIPLDDLIPAIKHFSKFMPIPQENIDEIVVEFLKEKKDLIKPWLVGICSDGGRVFRTLEVVCNLFSKKLKESI